jgi:hypothetical protein
MKNSELLTTRRQNPNCAHMLNFFDGAGIDIDNWKDKAGGTPCRCTACGHALQYVVPRLVLGGNGGWHWDLVPIDPKE